MTSPHTDGLLPAHLRLETTPIAAPENVRSGDNWRISVLDDGLVRLQWSPSGRFEDRASQAVLHRDNPPVRFTTRASDQLVEVITDRFHLTYDRGPFSSHGLSVQARGGISSYHSVWRFGSQGEDNLGGTARTLDRIDGPVPLEAGVLSRNGVACYDDSATVLLTDDGWFTPREPGSIDLYVFVYGRDYRAGLAALYRLTGSQPLLPRWALGNWWSRYHAYTDTEYLELLDRFAAERLPFSVAVLDMDWHLVDIPSQFGSGWTGYTWNRDLFADPPAFLRALHERGLKVTLNVHPADGIRAHEECYPAVAEAMGIDPASLLPVLFDPADPQFLATYLRDVHNPREAEGVDFWWIDWQQGPYSRVPGLDPLWLLNHLHFLDSARAGGPLGARPMTFSRYAGLGSHRYPVGFSGDTVVSWKSLAFQPEFTARASNVGYGWWSHDVGGHMFGVKDDELATRWVQLGVFSPILRLHSTHDIFNSKEPWRFGAPAREAMGRFLRLRHQLVPYLATMVRRAHVDGVPLVEPMYYEHPWQQQAYEVDGQFMFGGDLLVAPIVSPADRRTRLARVDAWLPPGEWVDLFTGVAYSGGTSGEGSRVPMHRTLAELPVLARAGTVLPLVPEPDVSCATGVPDSLQVWIVAGADGTFTLWEDADDDRWASTTLSYEHGPGVVTIGAAEGELGTVADGRRWSLVLVGFAGVASVHVAGRALDLRPGPIPGSITVDVGALPTGTPTTIQVDGDRALAGADIAERIYRLLDDAQIEFGVKAKVWQAVESGERYSSVVLSLHGMNLEPALLSALSELLLAGAA